jgi:PilZ domain
MNKRQEPRRPLLDTQIALVDVESGVEFSGAGTDVSDSGISFHSNLEPALGADMSVTLNGNKALNAEMKVTRVQRDAQGFQVAGRWAATS